MTERIEEKKERKKEMVRQREYEIDKKKGTREQGREKENMTDIKKKREEVAG